MLEVRGLSKTYGRRRVVADVDLQVRPGEIVALVGENGAGKSTLVKCIAGALVPDRGEISVAGGHRPAVVWQDLALCDNLDTVANVFLGAERGGRLLDEASMRHETHRLLTDIGAQIDDLATPVGLLSGGQRQMVAVARALQTGSPVLVLDEPTAALGVNETRSLEELLRRLRERGLAMLMVSHRIDQVFALADRIVVMRLGEVVADVSPLEVHPDDVIALMSGTPSDSTARRQLHQLRRLVDQLADVEPGASMPLIVSSLSRSLSTEAIGVWLADGDRLVLRADTGLSADAHVRLARLERDGGGVITAPMEGATVVLEDASLDPHVAALATSAWAVPIPGNDGPIGTIAGFAPRVGRPALDQLELAELHANLVAVALEREELLAELTRRNHLLESLRGLLDRLAGPEPVAAGIGVALVPLCQAIGADAVALYEEIDGRLTQLAAVDTSGAVEGDEAAADQQAFDRAVASVVTHRGAAHRAQFLDAGTVAVLVGDGGRRALLIARWRAAADVDPSAVDLLEDAARSLALALERQAVESVVQESRTLRRANAIQREFLHRLSHELRTPLTAIRGYAESLRQTDVEWDDDAHDRFLDRIASESARMGRLVSDLLDSSAIEHDQLRLQPDWCDLSVVVDEAVGCVTPRTVDGEVQRIEVHVADDLPVVWADHDRVEQVIVNLVENAVRHGAPPVSVTLELADDGQQVIVSVDDGGTGFPETLGEAVFEPHVSGGGSSGAGLGLAIARGIAQAHGGSLTVEPATLELGTRVVLRLPIEPADGAERSQPAAPVETPPREPTVVG